MANDPGPMVPRVDNPHAPEWFADDASGVVFHNGNLRITFEALRANHAVAPAAITRHVVGTIVMPIVAAEAMARLLLAAIENSKGAPTGTPLATRTLQ